MPIYCYRCNKCGRELEKIQKVNENPIACPSCGRMMAKLPTFPVMVKIKGMGGYPSRRKLVNGTAPYVSRDSKAWLDSDPYKTAEQP